MSKDICKIVEGWEYEPDEIAVRVISGDDGRDKIQMRLDLGVLQMEFDGRPDGTRPEGADSWLEYYEGRQQAHDAAHPDSVPFMLEESDVGRLTREGIQYYHRYLSLWHLKRYELCARDTARNLRLFAFIRSHARHERDKLQLDQWRPYVLMMHTRAVATPLVMQQQYAGALVVIDHGIESICEFLEDYDHSDRAEQCVELVHLTAWRDEIAALESNTSRKESRTALQILERKLHEAVSEERFEEAIRLRDEIRRLGGAVTEKESSS
ncbi:MAG: UvrB/UvrC motif-containing protein [Pirellulales bacterium]